MHNYSPFPSVFQALLEKPYAIRMTGRRGFVVPYTLDVNLQVQGILDLRHGISGILNPDTMLISYPVLLPHEVRHSSTILKNGNGALLANGAEFRSAAPFRWRDLTPAKLTISQYAALVGLFFEGQN